MILIFQGSVDQLPPAERITVYADELPALFTCTRKIFYIDGLSAQIAAHAFVCLWEIKDRSVVRCA